MLDDGCCRQICCDIGAGLFAHSIQSTEKRRSRRLVRSLDGGGRFLATVGAYPRRMRSGSSFAATSESRFSKPKPQQYYYQRKQPARQVRLPCQCSITSFHVSGQKAIRPRPLRSVQLLQSRAFLPCTSEQEYLKPRKAKATPVSACRTKRSSERRSRWPLLRDL